MSGRNFVVIHDIMRGDVPVIIRHGMIKGLLIECNPWVIYDYGQKKH